MIGPDRGWRGCFPAFNGLNGAQRLNCLNDLNGPRLQLPDTAIRLGTFFKTSAEFWMNLQTTYDLRNAEKALPARVRKSIEDNRSVLT